VHHAVLVDDTVGDFGWLIFLFVFIYKKKRKKMKKMVKRKFNKPSKERYRPDPSITDTAGSAKVK
jgi:hypothetical protein